MHQSMFAFVVVVANTVFAVSDVTDYLFWLSSLIAGFDILIVASQKSNDKK